MNKWLRSVLVAVAILGTSAQVMAQKGSGSDDADAVNELLSAGEEQVSVSDLLLDEEFTSSDAWEAYQSDDNTVSLKVAKGVYRMVYSGDGFTWGLNDDLQSNVVMQVETTQNSDYLNNSYGIICRADTENNSKGYYFRISGDGYYSISKSNGEEMSALVEWTQSDVVNQGTSDNSITAVCVEDYLALYVNDTLVAETRDDEFTEGYAGFSVGAYEDGDTDISFDNLKIWDASFGRPTSNGGGGDTTTLTNFDGDSEDAMAELVDLGIIPGEGDFIFGEDHAFRTGSGNLFIPLASDKSAENFVLGGELTFEPAGSDFEFCTFTSRIDTDSQGTATTFIDVGITSTGSVGLIDRFDENEDANIAVSEFTVELNVAHHLLIIMVDDVANVYVDGQLAIANFAVVDRSGTFGLALVGSDKNTSCDGRNIWAYEVSGSGGGNNSSASGDCTVSSDRNVNKRTGPGTNFDNAGQLQAGDDASVIGQAVGTDGQTWWQLEDENWVREDVVEESGDCEGVPIIKR